MTGSIPLPGNAFFSAWPRHAAPFYSRVFRSGMATKKPSAFRLFLGKRKAGNLYMSAAEFLPISKILPSLSRFSSPTGNVRPTQPLFYWIRRHSSSFPPDCIHIQVGPLGICWIKTDYRLLNPVRGFPPGKPAFYRIHLILMAKGALHDPGRRLPISIRE